MNNHAIIIGVDEYGPPEWKLSTAVDDALAFREWALGAGGVPPENLHLLLSPTSGRSGLPSHLPAERRNINQVIHEFQRGRGAESGRLYFYFAGHGSAAPGLFEDVSLFPADVLQLPDDHHLLLGLSQLVTPLQNCGPALQFFFVDACRNLALRDFKRGVGPNHYRWSPEARGTRSQYLLYATSPGGVALEMSRGVFGDVLLRGLQGAPGALRWSSSRQCYELSFSKLAEYVRIEVEEQVRRTNPQMRFVQFPQHDIPPGPAGARDCILAWFDREQVPPLSLRIRVHPAGVLPTCGVEVRYYPPYPLEGVLIRSASPTPPASLPFPVNFTLPPGEYTVLARATGFGEVRQPCALDGDTSLDLELRSMAGALDPNHPGPFRGDVKHHGGPPGTLAGKLIVRSRDPHARIVLSTPSQRTSTGFGMVSLDHPIPGIYRGRLVSPEGAFQERALEFHPGGADDFLLEAPPPHLGPMQQGMLDELGLEFDSYGYMSPSRTLGPVAHLRLASLLGFAAFESSLGTPMSGFGALGRFDLHPARPIPPGGSGLLVLLGVSGSRPMSGVSIPELLSRSRATLRQTSSGRLVQEGFFEELPRFGAAARWECSGMPGNWILELALPHLALTRYALATLPDSRSLLVIVLDDSGDAEVQQYMVPLPPRACRGGLPPPLDSRHLRALELAQRHLASGGEIPSRYLDPVRTGEHLDPLLGCMAGYAWVRAGQQARYRTNLSQTGTEHEGPSLLESMLAHFDGLPDSHVLAGLCEPTRRQAHFERALERGLPLFADGLRALHRHAGERTGAVFSKARQGLLAGSTWTAWLEHGADRP